nr:hypothetical protein [Bacteroidota bacterium]
GFPIPERSGSIRYFTRDGNALVWGDSFGEVHDKCPHIFNHPDLKDIKPESLIKSVSFIGGTIYENKALLKVNPSYLGDLLAQEEEEKLRLLEGNWKVRVDGTSLFNAAKVQDVFTNSYVQGGKRFLSADIALHGSDAFVKGVWDGWRLIDIEITDKCDGREAEESIRRLCTQHRIPLSSVCYDADGLGSFLKGYLRQSRPFHNGSAPLPVKGHDENFQNLKTQCYYRLAARVGTGELYITPEVAERTWKGVKVGELIRQELSAVRRCNTDADGRLQITPKEQMRNILGRSPDFADMLMMRELFDLENKETVYIGMG